MIYKCKCIFTSIAYPDIGHLVSDSMFSATPSYMIRVLPISTGAFEGWMQSRGENVLNAERTTKGKQKSEEESSS